MRLILKSILIGGFFSILLTCKLLAADQIVFKDVTVLQIEPEKVLKNRTVTIIDGKISRIEKSRKAKIADDAIVIDGRGKYLMPGLSDMHAHPYSERDLMLYLANGVTSLRSMWGEKSLLALRERVRAGEVPGPFIVTSGRIVGGAKPHHFGTTAFASADQAEALIDAHIADGYDYAKIYERVSLPAFNALAKAAKDRNFPIAGHVPMAVPLEHAMKLGMKSTEHMFGYLPAIAPPGHVVNLERGFVPLFADAKINIEAFGKGVLDPKTVYDDDRIKALARTAAKTGAWTVPSLVVVEGVSGMGSYNSRSPETSYMSPTVQDFWAMFDGMTGQLYSENYRKGYRVFLDLNAKVIKALHDAGANLLIGTDSPNPGVVTGFSVVDEMIHFEKAGLSRADVLRIATYDAARYFDRQDEVGSVSEGKIADLVLLDKNPLEDLEALRKPLGVMVRGQWLDADYFSQKLAAIKQADAVAMQPYETAPEGSKIPALTQYYESNNGQYALITANRHGGDVSVTGFQNQDSGEWAQSMVSIGEFGYVRVRSQNEQIASLAVVRGLNDYALVDTDNPDQDLGRGQADVVLSENLADLAALYDILSKVPVGQPQEIKTWWCPDEGCSSEPVTWSVKRDADTVIDGPFYFSGVMPFTLTPVGNEDLREIKVWFGGGAHGGSLFKVHYGDGENSLSWTRIR